MKTKLKMAMYKIYVYKNITIKERQLKKTHTKQNLWNLIHGPICTKIFYSNRIWLCENEIYHSLSFARLFVRPKETRRNFSQVTRSARNKQKYIITQNKKEYQIIKSSFCSLKLLHKKKKESCLLCLFYIKLYTELFRLEIPTVFTR